jgi:hypothetical protein
MSAHCYPVVVEGYAFDGATLFAHDDTTELTAPTVDSSHLHGPLERIAGLGPDPAQPHPLASEDAQVAAPPHTKPARGVGQDPGANQKGPT